MATCDVNLRVAQLLQLVVVLRMAIAAVTGKTLQASHIDRRDAGQHSRMRNRAATAMTA